jgi:hypothetical protein
MAEALQLAGEDFDASRVSAQTTSLALYTLRKKDLLRLDGLANLGITSLELRWVSAPDLTDIPLPASLEHLVVWQSPKLKSCDGIEQAPALQSLRWWDSGTLGNAAALARLPKLGDLRLASGMNEKQRISSLYFLRGLRLQTLALNGIRPHDLDIAPLLEMDSLRRICLLGSDWEIASFAALAARFPAVQADLHDLKDYPAGLGMRCPKCDGVRKKLWLRKRKFLWCPKCDATGLKNVLAQFDEMVDAARQSGVRALPNVEFFEE